MKYFILIVMARHHDLFETFGVVHAMTVDWGFDVGNMSLFKV